MIEGPAGVSVTNRFDEPGVPASSHPARIVAGLKALAGLLAAMLLTPAMSGYVAREDDGTDDADRGEGETRSINSEPIRPLASPIDERRVFVRQPTVKNEPWVEVTGSPHLSAWLAEQQVSLAFTTYQTGKLFLLGRHPEGRLAVFERTFNRAMGLWADGQTLWLSTLYQLWRFENLLRPGELYQGHDRLYVPKMANTTGDLDIHDVAIDHTGRPVFVATSFGCIATLSERSSFTPLWRPPFLSKLAAEDRCHLNGLALAEGRPRYVTAVSTSDVVDGWRDRRREWRRRAGGP